MRSPRRTLHGDGGKRVGGTVGGRLAAGCCEHDWHDLLRTGSVDREGRRHHDENNASKPATRRCSASVTVVHPAAHAVQPPAPSSSHLRRSSDETCRPCFDIMALHPHHARSGVLFAARTHDLRVPTHLRPTLRLEAVLTNRRQRGTQESGRVRTSAMLAQTSRRLFRLCLRRLLCFP